MSADQTEVVGQRIAIQLFAELSAERAAAHAPDKPAKQGTREASKFDAQRTDKSAFGRA